VAWLAFSLAPAYLPMLLQGQNGLLWIAGLLAALGALRAQHWILAGVIIGLLTLKPQYGLLIPIALLSAGLWRTFFSASATAVLVAAVPTFWTGLDYWVLFVKRMGEYRETISALIPELDMAASAFSFFVQLGLDPSFALICHSAVTLIVAISLFFIWRAEQVCFDTKAASLLIACFMASPIVWYNEAAFMALVGLFLLRAGVLGRTPAQLLLLAVLWFGAGLQAMAIFVGLGDHHFQWALVTTPVMLLCLALCLRQLGNDGSDKAELP
jgi:arabinofuranan 3-O-arabinosyltransferase